MNPEFPYLEVPEFIAQGCGVVRFATAPDGLPWLSVVPAPPDADDLLQTAAWALDVQSPPGGPSRYQGTPLGALSEELARILREQRIQRLPVPPAEGGGTLEVTVLPRPFQELGGRTLLERLLTRAPTPGSGTWMAPPPPAADAAPDTREALSAPPEPPTPPTTLTPATVAFAPPPPPPPAFSGAGADPDLPLPRFTPGVTRLALVTDGRRAAIVRGERTPAGWPRYTFRRLFTEETTAGAPGSRHEGAPLYPLNQPADPVPAPDRDRYRELRRRDAFTAWSWRVPRAAAAGLVLGVADELVHLHAGGEVHGDVKPANVLLTADGVRLIDSLGLREGARTPAMTRGWAAPEQVLGHAISPRTDQYALGLMLLELVNGVLFGEEARISVPVGGRRVELHTLLRNPGVYVDPDTAPVQCEHLDAWRNLIERCVRFDPEQRFGSAAELCDTLRPLTENGSLTGDLEAPLAFGRLVIASHQGTGERLPCWLAE